MEKIYEFLERKNNSSNFIQIRANSFLACVNSGLA